ncbi:hypothetical protein JOY44_23400 [Phormidium sp. CLA17]|uniref:hypothetical protein n=1 Tax=Leptolyngbya sp. Cla-17 TaxID=2803751 RepID=UPI0017C4046F|nr:hypothetical protein [Leptolyngbya sp. Cla-17]MBM0744518.1 hypothetical protein [Leptolyngbya sp. Cla-17]
MVLATPKLPTTFSLESLHTMKSITFEDPLAAVATQFIEVTDQIGVILSHPVTEAA